MSRRRGKGNPVHWQTHQGRNRLRRNPPARSPAYSPCYPPDRSLADSPGDSFNSRPSGCYAARATKGNLRFIGCLCRSVARPCGEDGLLRAETAKMPRIKPAQVRGFHFMRNVELQLRLWFRIHEGHSIVRETVRSRPMKDLPTSLPSSRCHDNQSCLNYSPCPFDGPRVKNDPSWCLLGNALMQSPC